MNQRTLGSQGLTVSELGLGCMGMSEFYGKADEQESVATLHQAAELGMTLLDTADISGHELRRHRVTATMMVPDSIRFGLEFHRPEPSHRRFCRSRYPASSLAKGWPGGSCC